MTDSHLYDLAILGAGPIGLEAALKAHDAGLDFVMLEKEHAAASLNKWGFVRMFSPFAMNTSARGREIIGLAPFDHCPTGREMKHDYYDALVRQDFMRPRLHEGMTVKQVGREGLLKGELIGNARRAEYPFLIYAIDSNGLEKYFRARAVIDATGVYDSWNHLGQGGLPALGELAHADHISYTLQEISDSSTIGKNVMVVGSGHSACNMVVYLAEFACRGNDISITWVTRAESVPPGHDVPDDPLPERHRVVDAANSLAADHDNSVTHLPGHWVGAIEDGIGENRLTVTLFNRRRESCRLDVDYIFAMVGYRPDRRLYEELQVHECYATAGTMKLAAKLLSSTASADCLEKVETGDDVYDNPEPNFYVLGSKSYGRATSFLIAKGLDQLDTVFRRLEKTLAVTSPPQAG